MTPEILSYLAWFFAGFAAGLLVAEIIIPATIDVWASGRRRFPAMARHRRRRDR